jgi:hypothetical protein
MASIQLNLSAFGIGTTDYTLRYRPFGTSSWVSTSGISPTNPIPTTTLNPTITGLAENTIYEIQLLGNCGASTSQSSIYRKITRECPSLLSMGVVVTDSTISANFPLGSLTPLTNHVGSITVDILQGVTLVNTQTIAPSTLNTVTFTGLTQNTTYTLRYTITYSQSDTITSTYSAGSTVNTQVCEMSVLTSSTPVCQTPVITSITEI